MGSQARVDKIVHYFIKKKGSDYAQVNFIGNNSGSSFLCGSLCRTGRIPTAERKAVY
jgi:hypothetical protein